MLLTRRLTIKIARRARRRARRGHDDRHDDRGGDGHDHDHGNGHQLHTDPAAVLFPWYVFDPPLRPLSASSCPSFALSSAPLPCSAVAMIVQLIGIVMYLLLSHCAHGISCTAMMFAVGLLFGDLSGIFLKDHMEHQYFLFLVRQWLHIAKMRRVLKPGVIFLCYEWCLTDRYDLGCAEHVTIKKQIEEGGGLLDIALTYHCLAALWEAGFEILEERNLVNDEYDG